MTSSPGSRRIESICLEALARALEERSAFLDGACAGDVGLRQDVEALLARAAGFLEAPAWAPPSTPLTAGTRIGPYQIQSAIGAGGMGEVYSARDTRLDRTVAIKILPPDAGGDLERRARFEREARTIAGLNHPNICTLHDVGEHEGSTFFVMEHIVGETLAARLEKGRLPVEQALTIATEIADALSAAHRQGVIHRDLKPANVMLTKAGAKLLDFGLAKLTGHGEQPAAVHAVPTPQATLTGNGVIVGTLHYMAPEQLEGQTPDVRTDLWALGAILYEMVTGKRAFEGTSAVSLMSAIMEREPQPIASVQPLPPALERLIRRCLEKDPETRWQNAADVAENLRWLLSGVPLIRDGTMPSWSRARRLALLAAVAFAGLLTGSGLVWLLKAQPAEGRDVIRAEIAAAPADAVDAGAGEGASSLTAGGARPALALAPDGRTLAFVGRQGRTRHLYVRALGAAQARRLDGTENAQCPTWSPDGRWLAFWSDGWLRKISDDGGPIVPICATPALPRTGFAPFGLAWTDDNRLVFAGRRGGLLQVPADGGAPTALTRLQPGEISHRLPHRLPGGGMLFTARKAVWSWGSEEIVAWSLTTGQRKTVLRGVADARYVPTGHLVYLQLGTLMARRFDLESMEPAGESVGLIENVAQSAVENAEHDSVGAGHVAISDSGTLAYVAGGLARAPLTQLVAVDRSGRVMTLPAGARPFKWTPVSSTDKRVAVVTVDARQSRLWITDLTRDSWTAVTTDGEAGWPRWTVDGQRLVYQHLVHGTRVVALHDARSGQPPTVLARVDLSTSVAPSSWSPDGRQLAMAVLRPEGTFDVAILKVGDASGALTPFAATPFNEFSPEFSPDGKWMAYVSDESGRDEVYLRPYPGPGGAWQVSTAGGTTPAWRPGGRELYYLAPGDQPGKWSFMSVDVSLSSAPRIGRPRKLFDIPASLSLAGMPVRRFDVIGDGTAFLALSSVAERAPDPVTHVRLVTNWFEELKEKVPFGR